MPSLVIDAARCVGDGFCVKICPAQVFRMKNDKAALAPLSEARCIACGQCVAVCPKAAITLDGLNPDTLPETDGALDPQAFALFAKSRRSIRTFKNKILPHDVLESALDVARYAPTGSNRQDVEWIAVEGEKLAFLAREVVDVMRGLPGTRPITDRFDKGEEVIFRGAPCAVFAHSGGSYDFSGQDCAVAATYLELALHSMGLGSCWAGYALRVLQMNENLRDALGLPKDRLPYSALMVGYPALRYRRLPVRKPLRLAWA